MTDLFQTLLDLLEKGETVILATITDHRGSTPRDTGTRMLIRSDGTIIDTIGGGLFESKVIEAAKKLFDSKDSMVLNYDMSKQELKADNMICGGRLSVLLETYPPETPSITFLKQFIELRKNRQNAYLIVTLQPKKGDLAITKPNLMGPKKEVLFNNTLIPSFIETFDSLVDKDKRFQTIEDNHRTYWVERLEYPPRLYLFGGGHVARPTAKLAQMAGFQTTVIDDRGSMLVREHFPEPILLEPIEDYQACLDNLEVDSNCYLAILTRSHTCDKIVLSQALKSRAKYIGMIGSRRKRTTIYQLLLKDGFSQEQLDAVRCPIGLDIGADTPEEIAVSIVAELIQLRKR